MPIPMMKIEPSTPLLHNHGNEITRLSEENTDKTQISTLEHNMQVKFDHYKAKLDKMGLCKNEQSTLKREFQDKFESTTVKIDSLMMQKITTEETITTLVSINDELTNNTDKEQIATEARWAQIT